MIQLSSKFKDVLELTMLSMPLKSVRLFCTPLIDHLKATSNSTKAKKSISKLIPREGSSFKPITLEPILYSHPVERSLAHTYGKMVLKSQLRLLI